VDDPILTFQARAEWYGIQARDVREVAQLRSVRPVPRAPGLVAGLAEVHGRIVTLIDLDRLLVSARAFPDERPEDRPGDASGPAAPAVASGSAAPSGGPFGVVLAPPYEHLGLLVRSEPDVAAWPGESADGGSAEAGGWLRARLPVGDRLLNLIALPALVGRVEEAIRAGFRPGGPGGAAGPDGTEEA
jgi:hypothetical protein